MSTAQIPLQIHRMHAVSSSAACIHMILPRVPNAVHHSLPETCPVQHAPCASHQPHTSASGCPQDQHNADEPNRTPRSAKTPRRNRASTPSRSRATPDSSSALQDLIHPNPQPMHAPNAHTWTPIPSWPRAPHSHSARHAAAMTHQDIARRGPRTHIHSGAPHPAKHAACQCVYAASAAASRPMSSGSRKVCRPSRRASGRPSSPVPRLPNAPPAPDQATGTTGTTP